MARRALIWGGAAVALVATAGLGAYFARVGLDVADRMASVIGALIALAGLGVSVYGLIADQGHGGGPTQDIGNTRIGGSVKQNMKAPGEQKIRDSEVDGDISQGQ